MRRRVEAAEVLIADLVDRARRGDRDAYGELVEKGRTLYRQRMTFLISMLEKYMPKGVTWTTPETGFSIMAQLPKGYSSIALLLFAIDKGVSFLPGPLFDIDHLYVNHIRMSVAWSDELLIKEGVELLADAVSEFISTPPGDSGLSGFGGYQ